MKLHLPTKLYAALMAVFAMNVSTTMGSDVISINFGGHAVADATGSLNGATTANWNNFADNVTNASLTSRDGATYAEAFTLTKAQGNWGSGITDANTVVSDMQTGYLDLTANNTWTVNLNLSSVDMTHRVATLVMYFSGDGGAFSPVAVDGTSYVGGTDKLAGGTTGWGDRSKDASTTVGEHNTVTLTNVDLSTSHEIKNVSVGESGKRATMSGMQIVLTDVYDATLAAGANSAESLTWLGPDDFSGSYTAVAVGNRYLRADVTAGDATLNFAEGATVDRLHVKGGNVLTLDAAGDMTLGSLLVDAGTTLALKDVLSDTASLTVMGEGTLTISENQTLAGLSGVAGSSLHVADGVTLNVDSYNFAGSVTAGAGAALNISLSPGNSSTVNGITVTNVSGSVGMNAFVSGVTDVNCSDGASIGIASSGGTLLVQGATGSTVTLASLSQADGTETKLTAAEGVALSGTLGSELLDKGKSLSVGKNVSLKYTTEDYSLGIGTGTLTINGGSVEAVSFRMGEGGSNRQSVLNITDGGLLNITGNVNSTGRNGTVRLCHWEGGSTSTLNVENGEFRVLDANVNVGDVGANTTINVGEKGVVNVKGFFRSENYTAFTTNVAAGGVLNLGEVGVNISNSAAVTLSISGTLGALSENGWSSGKTVTFNDGAILQLAVWDVENKQYTSTAADIKLTGTNAGTGALSLAGSGSLIISSALANDVSLADGATATLKLQGLGGFVYTNDGTYSGYGENTENGYNGALNYTVAGAGSTLDKVTVITGTGDAATETEYSLSNGAITITDSTKFFVNTDVTRSKIDEVREGTSFVLASGAIYRTDVLDDLKSLTVADKTAAVYVQSAEGKDLLKFTNVPNNWKPGLTVEGNTIIAAAPNYTADFTILSGATLTQSGNDNAGVNYLTNTNRTITVEDKATFDLGGHDAYYHMVLKEGATITNSGGAVDTTKRSLPVVDLEGNATVSTDSRLGILGSGYGATTLNLNGYTLTKEGSGVFHIHNCTIDKGTISINEGQVEILHRGATSGVTFVVNSSVGEESSVGSLRFSVDSSMAGLVGNGGNVTVDANRNVTILDKLTGTGFTKQGSGILTLSSGMQIADNMSINVEDGAITLSAINVAANKELAIAGAVQADALSKLGAGTLSIASLTANCISYTAGMGALEIETLAGNTIIDVTSMGEALAGGVNLGIKNTETNIANISLIAIKDGTWELVDDGTGYLKLQAKQGSTLAVSTDWDINWGYGLVGAPASTLPVAALTGNQSLSTSETYCKDGVVAVSLGANGQTKDNVSLGDPDVPQNMITGGKYLGKGGANENITADVWIHADGGAYGAIVGGNMAGNYDTGKISSFTGDTHILLDDRVTDDTTGKVAGDLFVSSVFGGNYADGAKKDNANDRVVFTGDTYISVYTDSVGCGVVGASALFHGGYGTFTGNSNVFVYAPLTDSGWVAQPNNTDVSGYRNEGDKVTGGAMVASGNMLFDGSANLTVDMTGYTGAATSFDKKIVGGMSAVPFYNNAANITQTNGNISLSVIGTSGTGETARQITFSDVVVGGAYISAGKPDSDALGAGNSTISLSDISVSINGGSYSSNVVGGAYRENGKGNTSFTADDISLSIANGTFNGYVVAGSYFGVASTGSNTPASTIGSTTLAISGGTFNGKVIGGDALIPVWFFNSNVGAVAVNVSAGAFNGDLIGGTYKAKDGAGGQKVIVGDVAMTLSGGSMTAGSKVVAGSWIGDTGGASIGTATVGDVALTITGGSWQDVLGGSYVERNNDHYVAQGDIVVDLAGGSIAGSVYAAGQQMNSSYLTTESTTVKLNSAVQLTGTDQVISGGYNTTQTNSTIAGDRVLLFTGDADQDRSGVAFKDFDKIGVETAGKTATIGALTATEAITIDGKGTIKLGGAATLTGGATVEGALDMNGQSVTGDVTVEGTLTSKGTSVAGTLTIGNAATLTDATAATNIVVDSYSNTKGLTATESITVGTKLTSSAALTAGKITGEGSVEITGGTVTLSDTTDAFANAGTTSIAGADLAGTWAADDVTIGEGVTVSGTISLANSTINSTITSTGSVALSGDVTVGVAGVEGSAYYTHDGSSSETGNGFKSASSTYDLVDGTSDVTAVDSWLIGGTAATNTSYTDGVLTVQTNADPATYWVNTGTVSYDGAAATYGDAEQSLADTTSIMLNGGTLKLTSGSVADGYISASTTSGTLDVNGQSITQAVFGTLDGTVELSGAGSYALGTGVTALATNVALGDGWTGTVKMSDVTLTNDAYSAFAATNLEVTTATISNQLVMNGGSLTLGGAITADMAGLADVTLESIAWSTGNEGTGFSTTSREVQLVDVDGTVSVADGTTWSAMEGTTATFNSTTGKLTVADNAWTTEFYISSDDVVDYSATDSAFTNADGKAATSLCMMGGTLNLNSALADTMTDGIEVIGTGNAISINGTDVALAKGSLNVLSGDVALSGNGIYDLSASAANTELGTGVSLAAGWTGTVKTGDFTSTGAVDITALGNGSSTVLAGAVSVGSLTGTSVNMTADSVALTTGASTLGTLTTGALTLGGAEAATLAVGTLNLGDAGTLTLGNLGTGSLFSIGTLEGSFDLSISHDVLATVGDKNTIVLGTLTGDKDATMTFNGTELVDGSWIYEAEGYLFTLGWDGDNLTISSKLLGSTWQGGEDDVWSEDSSWANGVTPDEENAALFQGEGNSTVTIEGTVTPGDVTIEIADGSANAEDGYTFVGGEIDSSGALNVISGQLTIENEANTFAGDSQVAGNGELVVGSEATFENNLENSGTITMDGGTLTVEGNLVNNGTLDLVDGTGTLTVGGQLTGTKSDLSGIGTDMTVELLGGYSDTTGLDVDGRLVVGGDSSITGLTGDGSVGVAEDGTLTLGSDTTIAVKDSEGTIDATGHKLTLGTGSDNTGDLMADTLNVGSAQGVVAGTITAKEIQFGTVEPGKDAVLNISDYTGEDILVTLDNAAADLATGRYHLISSDRAVDADDFSIADDYNQGVLMAGNIIELGTASAEGVATFGLGGDLYADVRVQTDEESTWFTSDSDSVAGQYITDTTDDSKLVYGYKTLDAIKHIVVDEDQTIDLSALTPDDENDSLVLRDVTGEGTLTLKGNGDDVATIVGGDLTGALDLQNITAVAEAPLTVGTMTGDADSTIGGTYEVTNSIDYTGSYAAATVKLEGATANLKAGEGLTVAGSKGTATLAYDSEATIDGFATTGADIVLGGTPTSTLTLTNASSMKGGSLSMDVDPAELGEQRIAGSLALSGTQVNVAQKGNTIQANGANVIDDVTSGVNVIASIGATADSTAQVTLTGKGFDKYFANARVEGGDIVADRNASYATDMIKLSTENGAAGAQLLDNLLVELNPQAESPDSQMAKLLTEVDNGSMSDEEAAALAGSSISALGLALSGDVERQLRSIRNRTTTMGVNECVVNEGMPYFNAWFNTESNRTKLDADSTNPGYTLDSWGGTVGFDVDVNPNFTMGLAISAMYGSITAEGPDSLDGDMDTYYLSLFARYADCAWTHTFVATLGKMDGSYSRTIPGWGATDASIDGTSFGLMYEVGYVIPLDEDGEACVQPIFNVMLRHSSVGSFVEENSELALDVDKQTMTTLTFGLGARLQAVVGESVYNRASIFEGRILAKADLGDRQSEADVAFVNGGSHKATVKSAELGTIGLELGAGLTIPLGDDDGSLFFDASVELRSGYTDVNGTVGYRINF